MRKVITIFMLSVWATTLGAQVVYRGMVMDQSGRNPLDAVSTSLLAADSTVLKFTTTDKDGRFELPAHQRAHYILLSYIGYKRVFLPLSEFTNGMTVTMQEETFKIREVKVVSERIRRSEDTLTYSVGGFKMPEDRSIEDVLKKMPGIEVAANGTIRYMDRPISAFYIEGADLLGKKYVLGSRNIPASMVKDVQVLEYHQPVAALRGKSFSDNAALNLVLGDNAKSRIIALIDLGLGVGDGTGLLWDNRVMGMRFGKKSQNITMYKNNNTGHDITEELAAVTSNALSNTGVSNFFSASVSTTARVEEERYLENESHLLAINHLYKPNADTDLRLQLSALHNEETRTYESGTTYYYPSQTITIDEVEDYHGGENKLEGELTYKLNSRSIYINNTLSGSTQLNKGRLELTTDGEALLERIHPQRNRLSNSFQLIKDMGKRAWSFYTLNSYSEQPQYMTVSPGIYEDLLNDGQSYESFRQRATQRNFSSNSYTYLQHKVAGAYLKYKVGVEYIYRKLTSSAFVDDVRLTDGSYANDLRMQTTKAYAEPSLSFKNAYWEWSVGMPLSFYFINLKYKEATTRKVNETHFLPMPNLRVKYAISGFWEGTLTSRFTYTEPNIRQLYAGYIFTSYRNASAYDAEPEFMRNWSNRLQLRYTNPMNGLFFSLSGSFAKYWRDIIYGYELSNGYLTTSQAQDRKNSGISGSASAKLSKAFSWSRLYVALSASYLQSQSKVLLEETLTRSTVESASLKLEFSLQPDRHFNLDGNSTASHTRSELDYEGYEASGKWSFKHHLNLNFVFSKQWKLRLLNTLSHDSRNHEYTYFGDATLTYTRKRWDLQLLARNIFNQSAISQVAVSGLTETWSVHELRPMEFLVKASFSF